ncbi:MAG: aspartate--tRNA ligase [Dehalococcoidia bacterium]|nr:aspartate--tRNA ligase [Chloroflexota bacterium]MDP6056623.1 aspartate--tRNA ligase [Dehalococcoidia bacterium]MDP7261363.1 aspartate--tRNA ligase [Dehalococcoidia bacterium]MDP7485612.1 aspartate--tRNA ligase [Dehalococcoidia bacterium]
MYKDTNCGEPRESAAGSQITVAGWVHRRRDHGNLIFIDLRDRSGLLQVVFNPKYSEKAHDLAGSLRSEWVVQVTGKVVTRLPGAENPDLPTGMVELSATDLVILNRSVTPPFEVSDEVEVDANTRLKYRFMDLRRPRMQEILKLRHEVIHIMWDYLTDKGFTQIETPILIKSTPEGARDYVVPSRVHPGNFYALPQSPQQLKQLLMVSGVERYFQIARCFRDEDLRTDRQPEHTQLDFEMSFVHQDDVMTIVEELYTRIVKETSPDTEISAPFPRLTYAESMERFGTDKPDLRFGMELTTITETAATSDAQVFQAMASSGGSIRGFSVPGCGDYGRRQTDNLTEFAKSSGAQGLVFIALDESAASIDALENDHIRSPLKKFLSVDVVKKIATEMGAEPGDLMLIVAGTEKLVNTVLSNLRNEMAKRLEMADPKQIAFAWVYDFPLFEWDEELKKYEPAHHVFSSPKAEHMDYLETNPGKVIGFLWDLVCNGSEMGSGSIRIHDKDLQTRLFNIIGYTEDQISDRFGQLLTAFTYGAPPHGGMGLGLDRLVAILAGEDAIREVIAFPKTQSAVDPLFEAPSPIEDQQLEDLHIRVVMPKS